MNKYLKYALMSLAVAMVFVATSASATSGNVFQTVLTKMLTTFKNSRSVIFVVGGFGLIGLGFAAIFGKVNWKWLAALACGLAIVAVAGQVVDYVTQADVAEHKVARSVGLGMEDTGSGDTSYYGSGNGGINSTETGD